MKYVVFLWKIRLHLVREHARLATRDVDQIFQWNVLPLGSLFYNQQVDLDPNQDNRATSRSLLPLDSGAFSDFRLVPALVKDD